MGLYPKRSFNPSVGLGGSRVLPNPKYKLTSNLLRGLRELISTVIIGVLRASKVSWAVLCVRAVLGVHSSFELR